MARRKHVAQRMGGSKRLLLIVFVPSVERDGRTKVDQEHWVREALETLGKQFGGATAYPRAQGVWRDDERDGNLVYDEPVVVHCYTTETDLQDDGRQRALRDYCRRLGRETNQGEVGLVIDNHYIGISDFTDEE